MYCINALQYLRSMIPDSYLNPTLIYSYTVCLLYVIESLMSTDERSTEDEDDQGI